MGRTVCAIIYDLLLLSRNIIIIIILSTHGGGGGCRGHARRADGGKGVTRGVALTVPDNRSTVNIETMLICSIKAVDSTRIKSSLLFPTTKIVNLRYLILAIELEFLLNVYKSA